LPCLPDRDIPLRRVRLWGIKMKWFRLWTDILDDVKILQLSDYEFRVWIQIMAYASSVDSMSGECRTKVNHFSHAIETFQKLDMVTINEQGFISINNWNKRQFRSDNAYERVKKFREVTSKRNVSKALHETAPDTDTDTDKPPISPKKRGTKNVVFVLPEWIKAETWDSYREMRTRKRAPLTERASALIVKELEKLKGLGDNPEDVLNQSIMKSWTGVFPISRGGNGQRKPYGERGPGISLPLEWKGDDIPEISEADRERNVKRARELANKFSKG
jgi:hypothetical protein